MNPDVALRNRPHLTLFRAAGTRPQLVLVPGVDGYAFAFRQLSQLLGDDQPVCGLQLLGAELDEEIGAYSIEQMAAVFELQIIAAFPEGPIVVGGFSMGALLALELARRLLHRGREVPLLISLDGCAPRFYRQEIASGRRVRAHLRALRADPRTYLAKRSRNIGRRLLARVGREWLLVPAPQVGNKAGNERLRRLVLLWERASERYAPEDVANLSMLLIRSANPDLPLGAIDDGAYGWRRYVKRITAVIEVGGDHASLLRLQASQRTVAEAIARHIDDAISSPRRNEAVPREPPDGDRS